MGILNPVVSKFSLTAGTVQEVYSCPASKSHATVDLSFFKDNLSSDAMIEIALSTKTSAALLTSVDYFIDDIELLGAVNSAELNKVIVGAGERLYIRVITGPDIVVRLSGVEESNPMVAKAGCLAALAVPGTTETTIFHNNLPNISYTTCSITIYNASEEDQAEIQAWICAGETTSAAEKVMRITIPSEDTTIVENLLLAPGERIIVSSTRALTEYFVNGISVKAVGNG